MDLFLTFGAEPNPSVSRFLERRPFLRAFESKPRLAILNGPLAGWNEFFDGIPKQRFVGSQKREVSPEYEPQLFTFAGRKLRVMGAEERKALAVIFERQDAEFEHDGFRHDLQNRVGDFDRSWINHSFTLSLIVPAQQKAPLLWRGWRAALGHRKSRGVQREKTCRILVRSRWIVPTLVCNILYTYRGSRCMPVERARGYVLWHPGCWEFAVWQGGILRADTRPRRGRRSTTDGTDATDWDQ
jgi:hypothetical protein